MARDRLHDITMGTLLCVVVGVCVCGAAYGFGLASGTRAAPAMLWLISTESLAPILISSLALAAHLVHRSRFQWR